MTVGTSGAPMALRRDELVSALLVVVRLWQLHDRPVIVQIAGVRGGEGASTVARALAEIVQAETGSGVLLASFDRDGEPGRPFDRDLVRKLAAGRAGGASDGGGVVTAQLHDSALRHAVLGQLDLGLAAGLPAGVRLVLLDTGPILQSIEAAAIGAQIDGTVLVVSASATPVDETRRAIAAIATSGGNLLGLVLNRRRYRLPSWLSAVLGQPTPHQAPPVQRLADLTREAPQIALAAPEQSATAMPGATASSGARRGATKGSAASVAAPARPARSTRRETDRSGPA